MQPAAQPAPEPPAAAGAPREQVVRFVRRVKGADRDDSVIRLPPTSR